MVAGLLFTAYVAFVRAWFRRDSGDVYAQVEGFRDLSAVVHSMLDGDLCHELAGYGDLCPLVSSNSNSEPISDGSSGCGPYEV